MKMKRVGSFIIVLALVLSLCSCTSDMQGDMGAQPSVSDVSDTQSMIDLQTYGFKNMYGMNIWALVEKNTDVINDRYVYINRHFKRFGDGAMQESFINYDEILETPELPGSLFGGSTVYNVISNDVIEYRGDYGWGTITITERIVDETGKRVMIKYDESEPGRPGASGRAVPFALCEIGETASGDFYARFKE